MTGYITCRLLMERPIARLLPGEALIACLGRKSSQDQVAKAGSPP